MQCSGGPRKREVDRGKRNKEMTSRCTGYQTQVRERRVLRRNRNMAIIGWRVDSRRVAPYRGLLSSLPHLIHSRLHIVSIRFCTLWSSQVRVGVVHLTYGIRASVRVGIGIGVRLRRRHILRRRCPAHASHMWTTIRTTWLTLHVCRRL